MAMNLSSLRSATANMTSMAALRSVLSMPSRLYHQIRRVDDLVTGDLQMAAAQRVEHISYSSRFFTNLPGPWAFITSGYAVTLLIMAVLLNRIQHIVVPPRYSFINRPSRHFAQHSSPPLFRVLLSSLFPLNLSSTTARLLLRSPSIYLLLRSLSHFIVIIFQTSDLFPSFPWLAFVSKWGARAEMAQICWNTFIAVCVALTTDAIMRGLDGSNNSSSPFNLFGYAFLLHIYSSPITHLQKQAKNVPTRPDKHVLITITIPLLQLTLLHVLSIRRTWINQRLVPTTICSLLTLSHFHYVLLVSPTPYPLINYLPSVIETVLIFIILLTVCLHALTQFLLEGRISRPVLGHPRVLTPRWEEEFSVAILRVGTACLEATSAAGMGNEVVGVESASNRRIEPEIELGRAKVVGIRGMTGHSIGFHNEIKHVKAATTTDGDKWAEMVIIREWGRFLRGIWGVLRGVGRVLRRETLKWMRALRPTGQRASLQPAKEGNQRQNSNGDQDEELYRRFLQGEVVSDDDTDFVDEGRVHNGSPSASDSEDDAASDSEGREAASLYAALSVSTPTSHRAGSTTPPPPVQMLLAHVTSQTPLTRQRYNRFIIQPEDWDSFAEERRAARSHEVVDDAEKERRQNCVVCTISTREIICWPCRCLALCDDCRANIASRSPASKHTCPCCRTNVEGYSRIHIP